jgi:hypothetical protein
MTPDEKIEFFGLLQNRCYEFLLEIEKGGGFPVPEPWRHWRAIRKGCKL